MGSRFLGLLIHELGHTCLILYDGQGFNYDRAAEYTPGTPKRLAVS